jgi:hypothetical protein
MAGWAPGSVWIGAENFAATGIRSPDRPARSQSLYRLSYPAHFLFSFTKFMFSIAYYHPVQISFYKFSPSRLQQNAEVSCRSTILCSSKYINITNANTILYPERTLKQEICLSMKINNLDVFWQSIPWLALHFSCLRNWSSNSHDIVWPVPPREEIIVVSVTNTRPENTKKK